MKYKGFEIKKRYAVGSDFDIGSNNQIKPRRPRKEDVECYDILDPMEGMSRFDSEPSIEDCKANIDSLLSMMSMKSNSPEAWAAL